MPEIMVSGCGAKLGPAVFCSVHAACRIFCSRARALSKNLSGQTVASSQYDLLFSSKTLVSDFHHVSE